MPTKPLAPTRIRSLTPTLNVMLPNDDVNATPLVALKAIGPAKLWTISPLGAVHWIAGTESEVPMSRLHSDSEVMLSGVLNVIWSAATRMDEMASLPQPMRIC